MYINDHRGQSHEMFCCAISDLDPIVSHCEALSSLRSDDMCPSDSNRGIQSGLIADLIKPNVCTQMSKMIALIIAIDANYLVNIQQC